MAIKVGDAILFVSADTKGLDKNLSAAEKRTQQFGKAANRVGKSLVVGGGAIVGALGLAVKRAADFEQAITNAAVVTGETGEALGKAKEALSGLAQELGQTTVFTASEAADALGILARKGFDVVRFSVEDAQPFLDLAAATQTGLAEATDIAASALRQFGIDTKDVSRVTDVFVKAANTSSLSLGSIGEAMKFVGPLASAAGVSLEETVAALGQLADKGIDGSIAGTGLRRTFTALLSPTKQLTDILSRLGVDVDDVNLKSNTLAEVLATLKDAGFDTGDAMDAFGDRAGVIVEALGEFGKSGLNATEDLKNLRDGFLVLGLVAEDFSTNGKQSLEDIRAALSLITEPIKNIASDTIAWAKATPEVSESFIDLAATIGVAAIDGGLLAVSLGVAIPKAFKRLKSSAFGSIEALSGFATELEAATGTSAQTAEEQLKTLAGQMKLLAAATESVLIPTGQALIPVLSDIAKEAADISREFAKWTKQNPETTETIVKTTGSLGVAAVAIGVLGFAVKGLVRTFGGLNTVIKFTLGLNIGAWFKTAIGSVGRFGFLGFAFAVKTTWEQFSKLGRFIDKITANTALGAWINDQADKAVFLVNKLKEAIDLPTTGDVLGPGIQLTQHSIQSAHAERQRLLDAQRMAIARGESPPSLESQSPLFKSSLANGGFTKGPTLVGENGPEIIRPPSGSRVFSNAESRAMSDGNSNVEINININGANISNSEEMARVVGNAILQLQNDRQLNFGALA